MPIHYKLRVILTFGVMIGLGLLSGLGSGEWVSPAQAQTVPTPPPYRPTSAPVQPTSEPPAATPDPTSSAEPSVTPSPAPPVAASPTPPLSVPASPMSLTVSGSDVLQPVTLRNWTVVLRGRGAGTGSVDLLYQMVSLNLQIQLTAALPAPPAGYGFQSTGLQVLAVAENGQPVTLFNRGYQACHRLPAGWQGFQALRLAYYAPAYKRWVFMRSTIEPDRICVARVRTPVTLAVFAR